MKIFLYILIIANLLFSAPELIIGEERVEPGIVFIFEGAVKDHVMPTGLHLEENQTHVHIEARVNWDVENIPEGTPAGGFVPYLYVNAIITNQSTGLSTFVDLLPHINLIDNFHYARNITLPGKDSDFYSVEFNIMPPSYTDLALHRDWLNNYGELLLNAQGFIYKDVFFQEICRASRQ